MKHLLISLGFVASCTLSATTAFANSGAVATVPGATTTANVVTAGGKPITLLGEPVQVGDDAPQFTVVNERFEKVSLSDFADKTVMISVVPSLDTGVCSTQTKRFNDEASALGDDVVLLTISNDLPFAQKRFCTKEKVNKIMVLSDSVWRDFGNKYGLLIKDMGLLTRAILIIDKHGKVAYKELVKDISNEPDYDTALMMVK
ncbi:thiol peroxidase [Thalassotalea litorea]|uniref:thiol peroxidase n=1 Tax=Thalassotalea litorea TaxID=2020715 RepID=UPI003735C5C2